jgi:hypothetical protein
VEEGNDGGDQEDNSQAAAAAGVGLPGIDSDFASGDSEVAANSTTISRKPRLN